VYQGGLFSLDGVHPSAIGQGLLAHEFAAVMKAAGVAFARDLDWSRVVRSDSLSWKPLNLIQEAFQHPELAALFLRRMSSKSAETVPAHPGMMTDEDTAGR
jgi:hypothetical protein